MIMSPVWLAAGSPCGYAVVVITAVRIALTFALELRHVVRCQSRLLDDEHRLLAWILSVLAHHEDHGNGSKGRFEMTLKTALAVRTSAQWITPSHRRTIALEGRETTGFSNQKGWVPVSKAWLGLAGV